MRGHGIAFAATKGNSMTNRFNGAAAKFAQQLASQPVTWTSVSKTARGLLTTAQHTLTVFGISALVVGGALYARPELARAAVAMVARAPGAAPRGRGVVKAPP